MNFSYNNFLLSILLLSGPTGLFAMNRDQPAINDPNLSIPWWKQLSQYIPCLGTPETWSENKRNKLATCLVCTGMTTATCVGGGCGIAGIYGIMHASSAPLVAGSVLCLASAPLCSFLGSIPCEYCAYSLRSTDSTLPEEN